MRDTTAHKVLSTVEQLPTDGCGALTIMVDDQCVGTVFVENARVCWAAHAGLHRRLRDLLREHLARAMAEAELPPGDDSDDASTTRSVIKATAMRSALQQHTIESLLALPQDQGEYFDWIPHRHQTYQPRFTFSPAELLIGVNAFLYDIEATGADKALAVLDPAVSAASYVAGDTGGLAAVRVAGPEISIAQIDELGAWAEAALGVTGGFASPMIERAIEAASGEIWIGWETSRRLTHVAILEGRAATEFVISTLRDQRYPVVISRRATGSSRAVRDGLGTVVSRP
ncbi:MAG: hypothetical protein AB7O24_28175 [Kofleriaceae bacterium]